MELPSGPTRTSAPCVQCSMASGSACPPPPVSPACETRVCVSSRAGTLTELSLFLRVSLCVSLSLCVRLLAATATHGRFSWAHSDHRTLATMHVSDTTPFSLPRCCSLCLCLCLSLSTTPTSTPATTTLGTSPPRRLSTCSSLSLTLLPSPLSSVSPSAAPSHVATFLPTAPTASAASAVPRIETVPGSMQSTPLGASTNIVNG